MRTAAALLLAVSACVLPDYANVGGDDGGDDGGTIDAGPPGSCSEASQCNGAPCVDGWCCDDACDGPCEQCDLAGVEGTCTLSPVDSDPDNECGANFCDGAGACATACGPGASCKITHGCVQGACALQRPRQMVVGNAIEGAPPLVVDLQTPTLPRTTLVVVASLATTTQHITGITDDAGNTWINAATAYPATQAYPTAELWYAADAEPITTFTVTLSQSRDVVVELSEWIGLASIGVLDRSVENAGAVSLLASSGPIAVTAAEDLVIGVVGIYGTATVTLDPLGGFTPLPTVTFEDLRCHSAYRLGTAGSYEAQWALGSMHNWTGVGASLVLE